MLDTAGPGKGAAWGLAEIEGEQMGKTTHSFRLCSLAATIGLTAMFSLSPAVAHSATGPARVQRLAAAQTQLLLRNLRTEVGVQTASPTRCNQDQDNDVTRGTFLLPTLAGGKGSRQFRCRIEARRVLVDLGGAFVTEDDRAAAGSVWTTANGEVLPFTRANLERICDDIRPRLYPAPAPATVDGKPIAGATAVSTQPFSAKVRRSSGLLYQDSVDLGHPGRLATTYCGWKAIVPLKRGRHVIRVDLSKLAPPTTVFTYKIKVADDDD
jgi:hypothetical protein